VRDRIARRRIRAFAPSRHRLPFRQPDPPDSADHSAAAVRAWHRPVLPAPFDPRFFATAPRPVPRFSLSGGVTRTSLSALISGHL